ncbi:TIM barrel protein [bacterium]|nr:TIM barrel protein [bacterium]
MKRRTFIASSAAAGAALMATDKSASAKVKINQTGKEGVLNFSFQERIAPIKTDAKKDPWGALNEKLDWMEAHGVVGLEPGGWGLDKRVDEFKKALNNRNIKISAICAGFQGSPCSHEPSERQKAKDTLAVILQAAGELDSVGVIFVPAFNNQTKLSHVGLRYMLLDFCQEMGPVAEKAGCPLLIEPLRRGETWYVRQLSDAARICQEVDHPYIQMMGDFFHMGREEACDYGAFITARDHLRHVHLGSRPTRRQPSYDPNDDYRPGFQALKEIGYQGYCSYECGITGKNYEEKEKNLITSLNYLRQHWEEA